MSMKINKVRIVTAVTLTLALLVGVFTFAGGGVAAAPQAAPVIISDGLVPAPFSLVSPGQVTISCNVQSDNPLTAATMTLDGKEIPAIISGGSPYQVASTVTVAPGQHRIVVQVTDNTGAGSGWHWDFTVFDSGPTPGTPSTPVAVATVAPTSAATAAPTSAPVAGLQITPLAPPAGWIVPVGAARISALFRSASALGDHSITLDGQKLDLEGGGPGPEQETLFGETNVAAGLHKVTASGADTTGASNSVSWSFVAAAPEGQGDPTINAISPLPGATVDGSSVLLSAKISSLNGLGASGFMLDGSDIGPQSSGPVNTNSQTISHELKNLAPGQHVVTVTAKNSMDRANSTAWVFYVGSAATSDRLYFSQTGYSITGPFLKYWNSLGANALQVLGYPISGVFVEQLEDGNSYTVQYFERVRLEWHPEYVGTENEVLYGLLGIHFHTPDAAAPQPAQAAGQQYFPETGHTVKGAMLTKWQSTGGLRVSGYPITEEISEVSPTDGKTYTVQYFQRARFEYHPENVGGPYEVLLGLLGRQLFAQNYPDR